MKSIISTTTVGVLLAAVASLTDAELIKMCLFYKPSGHARTDPILSQTCASDHVHTFYGPQLFHPSTTPADLRNSDPRFSTSVFTENKSLYWHPTIYKVGQDAASGLPTYERAEISFAGPYYRWDKAAPLPAVEAFPPGFQMIAGMNPNQPGLNLFSECLCQKPCSRSDGLCSSTSNFFPSSACGEMGIAMNFPTCWDDSKGLGDTGDHMSHMAYTVDGTVEGACPEGYNRRLPQIQLFVRVKNYEGGQYTFSDNTLPGDEEVYHADFMNGWDEGALETIVDQCQPAPGTQPGDYNPPCNCEQFLTKKSTLLNFETEEGSNNAEAANICPIDVNSHIINEETAFSVGGLPRGTCTGTLINGVAPPFVSECGLQFTPNNFNEENCQGGDVVNENENENEIDEEEPENENENENEIDEEEPENETEDEPENEIDQEEPENETEDEPENEIDQEEPENETENEPENEMDEEEPENENETEDEPDNEVVPVPPTRVPRRPKAGKNSKTAKKGAKKARRLLRVRKL